MMSFAPAQPPPIKRGRGDGENKNHSDKKNPVPRRRTYSRLFPFEVDLKPTLEEEDAVLNLQSLLWIHKSNLDAPLVSKDGTVQF
jgi:hypothetical protein